MKCFLVKFMIIFFFLPYTVDVFTKNNIRNLHFTEIFIYYKYEEIACKYLTIIKRAYPSYVTCYLRTLAFPDYI